MFPLPPPPYPAISSTAPAPAAAAAAASNKLVVALMGSVNSLWVMWKKKVKSNSSSTKTKKTGENSSIAKSKKFLAKMSSKATNFRSKKKGKNVEVENDEDFGHGGLWEKEILMGEKCQPLDFSGVIYYDRNGKRLSEVPAKSPRASPLPSNRYA